MVRAPATPEGSESARSPGIENALPPTHAKKPLTWGDSTRGARAHLLQWR